MKSKITSMLDTTKKKVGVALLCGALVVAIGAGAVFAANPAPFSSLLAKMENGVRSYSTDDGKTWSEKAPDGVTVSDEDGKVTITNGVPPRGADGKGLLSKVENGVRSYSTDDGKTWSEKAPDGVTVSDEDGKVTIMNGVPPTDADGKAPDGAEDSMTIGRD